MIPTQELEILKMIPTNPGAGAVEMKFFTTVNVTAVKLFGTATRGEKVQILLFIIFD